MKFVHEALKARDELRVRLDVQLGGKLAYQALFALVRRTEHDSVLLDAPAIDERLDCRLGRDVILCPIGSHLGDQEHAILLFHQAY